MESGWTQDLLNWVATNPGWSGFLVFLVSFIESLILVGFIVPGIFILFGVGTLIGLGIAEFVPIWIGGSVGAFLGDIVSYWVGHRYRGQLREIWPFSRYPGLLDRGERFFRRHGSKSVLAGRFIGPLRPVIPATAGMLGMTPSRFTGIAIPAGVLWSPAYLLPGMLFGASLEVASEYAGRLTLIAVVVVAILWLTLWVIATLYALFESYSARWMRRAIRFLRRHPVLGRVAGPIIDPDQPEVLAVSMLGLILVLTLWALLLLLFLSPFAAQPAAVDLAVLNWTQSVRNHIADPFMVAVMQVSRWWVLLPTSAATLLWLLGAQRFMAAAHWLVAMAGGVILQFLLSWTLRSTPAIFAPAGQQLYVPSAPVTLTAVVLGFFAVMVARELRRSHRKWPYLISALLLALLLVARVYLGLDWLSGGLFGCVLGLSWTAIVGIAYRQRALKPFSGVIASGIFYGVMLMALAWQVDERLRSDLDALRLPLPERSMSAEAWWSGEWASLPSERADSANAARRHFNLHLAAPPNELQRALPGWEVAEPVGWKWILQALNPRPDEGSLALIGKDYLGQREVLALRRSTGADDRQLVLRLWDSGVRLQPTGQVLYFGQWALESLVQRFRLISYWRAAPVPEHMLETLAGDLARSGRLSLQAPRSDLWLIRPADPIENGGSPPAGAAAAEPGQ